MAKRTYKRKEREREARREAILNAAGRVMSLKGFHEATLEEIAEEAELAKGTLYLYYKDKEDLFYSLIERGYEDFRNILPSLADTKETLQEFVEEIFNLSLEYMMSNRYLFRVIFSAEYQMPQGSWEKKMDHLRDHLNCMIEVLRKVFSEIPETSNLTDADKKAGAELILASLRYLFVTRALGTNGTIPDQDIKHFSRFISRALSTEHAA